MPKIVLLCGLVCLGLLTACDGTQTVSVTAEDFRFTPEHIRVAPTAALTLTVYNAGREIHEFDSPVLMYAAALLPREKTEAFSGVQLKPGESLKITVVPPPGTYLYICRRKGHANMTGTMVVE